MENLIGTKLDGRYEIHELIGEGGMANVYRGTDLLENKVIAVKVLREDFEDNEEVVRRFKNESRAISVLNDDNIVKVFDVSIGDKGPQYMVMEYIDGITLKEYIEQRGEPLTYKETVHFVGQILKALQHAHDKGIVHRDIKPQNIMIVEDGSIRVMDFGIARMARSEIHTATDQAIGSVHYISPEQAQGAETDPRADLYSLGIMMYEMLTGQLPFESDNAVSVAIKQISDEAEPLLQVNPSIPAGLAEITMKAMAKDPKNRYKDAYDMLRDIEEFKQNPSIKFEYDYIADNAPARYIDKVVNSAKKPAGNGATASKSKTPPKKKMKLLVPIVAIITIAVVLTCGLYSWSLFQNSGNPLFVKVYDVELPDFVGMTYDEAMKVLKQEQFRNLRVQPVTEEYNPDVPQGVIISQNPSSANDNKKTVKSTQKIFFVVSGGIKDVTIPDLSNMSRTEAKNAILDLGLRPHVKSVRDSNVPAGLVIGTDPAAGAVVQNIPGTTVTIFVSVRMDKLEFTVPNLVGLESADAARSVLSGLGVSLGAVSEEFNEAPAGQVIRQSPEPGTIRMISDSVSITISKGPEPPPPPPPPTATVPNFVGLDIGAAYAEGSAAKIQVREVGRNYDPAPVGQVISQNIGAGTTVDDWTFVEVVVSNGPAPVPPASSATPPAPSESSAAEQRA